ncbi:MAG TPA: hypothetical protein PLM79_17475, partial [Syntrophobacteraceae bacterium]|nr:hypothetical protein [Syntrophobacteraceae bacterium]
MSSQPGKLLPPSLQASRLPGLSGRGGGQEGHTPTEDPNNLLANSIANMVDVLGEGPIYGLADQDHKKRCIFLDDVALQTDTGVDNFEGVQIQERKGHPSQDPFKNVDSIEAEVPVGVEITKAVPVVRTVTDTDIDDIRIKIMLPSLLRINKKTGDIHGTKVELRFFIRRDGGTYKKVKDVKISGKTNAQYIREYRIPNIA